MNSTHYDRYQGTNFHTIKKGEMAEDWARNSAQYMVDREKVLIWLSSDHYLNVLKNHLDITQKTINCRVTTFGKNTGKNKQKNILKLLMLFIVLFFAKSFFVVLSLLHRILNVSLLKAILLTKKHSSIFRLMLVHFLRIESVWCVQRLTIILLKKYRTLSITSSEIHSFTPKRSL